MNRRPLTLPLALPLLLAAGLLAGVDLAVGAPGTTGVPDTTGEQDAAGKPGTGPRDLGCSASPAVAKAIEEIRTGFPTCVPHQNCWLGKIDAAARLIERFPEDVHAHRYYQDVAFRQQTPDGGPIAEALTERYQTLAAEHPDDALFQFLSGRWEDDRSEMARAAALDPAFAWPRLWLASFKIPEGDEARTAAVQDLETFLRVCPDRLGDALRRPSDKMDAAVLRAQVPVLRRAVEAAPRSAQVQQLPQLWALEFRATPPAEHEGVRRSVAADLARLESWPRNPEKGGTRGGDWTHNEEWWQLRHHGYTMLDNPEGLEHLDAAYARRFPCSRVAIDRLYDGWAKTFEANRGFDAVPAAGWQEAARLFGPASDRCPDEYRFMLLRFEAAERRRPPLSDRLLVAEARHFLEGWERLKSVYYVGVSPYHDVAVAYLRRGLEPDTVLDLVRRDRADMEAQRQLQAEWDAADAANASAEKAAERKSATEESARFAAFDLLGLEAEAHLVAGRPTEAESALREAARGAPSYVPSPAAPAPAGGRSGSGVSPLVRDAAERYERVRRRLGLPAEAAAQAGDATVTADGATMVGGTATPDATASAGGWTPRSDALPEWTLTDLTGRSWRSADLRGKTVVVNVWATWCGPCRSELPSIKSLVERLAGREDVLMLSFNVDADVGLVAPFVKAQGLTWPILLASDYMGTFEDGLSVPQTWILDAAGVRRRMQKGFSPLDNGWVDETLALIDGVASGAVR